MHQQYQLAHRDALAIVTRIQAELEKDGKGAAVAVVDRHGELMAFLRTDGCPLTSITIAINKAFTAARERQESRAVGDRSRKEDWPMSNLGDSRFVSWGGGVPIVYQGEVVGAVGVSGLTEDEDVVLARLGTSLIE
ncbi:MAG: heme-binding protein [Chloroflexota bacterium]|jgi:glc operon protein GlcG